MTRLHGSEDMNGLSTTQTLRDRVKAFLELQEALRAELDREQFNIVTAGVRKFGTVEAYARACGYQKPHLSLIKNGKTKVAFKTALILLDALEGAR